MGSFEFPSSKAQQLNAGQSLSSNEIHDFLPALISFCIGSGLEIFASKGKTELTLSEDEAGAIVQAAYRQFLEAVPSTDTLLRVAKCGLSTATREHSLRSVELYEEYLVGALVGAKTILEPKSELAGQYAAKLEGIVEDASTYVPKVLETCLSGFLASLAWLNSDCRFKDYDLCLGAVEKALAGIAGKDMDSAPISFSSANHAEYIQAYFYPSRCLEDDTLSFTYKLYRDLFGEACGILACARRKLADFSLADGVTAGGSALDSAILSLQVLEDRDNRVFSLGMRGREIPLDELVSFGDKKELFGIRAPGGHGNKTPA